MAELKKEDIKTGDMFSTQLRTNKTPSVCRCVENDVRHAYILFDVIRGANPNSRLNRSYHDLTDVQSVAD